MNRRFFFRAGLIAFAAATGLANTTLSVARSAQLTYYVDSEVAEGGDGTIDSPWDDFTEVNAFTPEELDGIIISLKRDSIIFDRLLIKNSTNFTVTAYGQGAKPIIDGSVPYIGIPTQVSADPNIWTLPGTAEKNPIINDNYCARRTSLADIQDTTKDFGWEYMYFWTGSVVQVRAPVGVNVSTATIRICTISRPLNLQSCSDVTIENIHARRGLGGGQINVESTGNNIVIQDCEASNAGQGEVGMNAFAIAGVNGSNATGCKLLRSYGHHCQNNNGNGIEANYLDGLLIQDCVFEELTNNGIEFWNNCNDSIVDRCHIENVTGGIWYSNAVSNTPAHANPSIINTTMTMNRTYKQPKGPDAVKIDNCADLRMYNCSIYTDGVLAGNNNGRWVAPLVTPVATGFNRDVHCFNCSFHDENTGETVGTSNTLNFDLGAATENGANATLDNCIMWARAGRGVEGRPWLRLLGMTYAHMGLVNNAGYMLSGHYLPPSWTDPANGDFSISTVGPEIGVGKLADVDDPLIPATDKAGKERAIPPACGAYEPS